MHGDSSFLIDLLVILFASSLGAWGAKRLNQPQIVGQIIGGVLIGPSVLGLVQQGEFISHLSEIGVIVLMFITGLETDLVELKRSAERSASIAVGGVLVPFVMGAGLIFLLKENFRMEEAVFLGVTLTATSMGVTVKLLAELKVLQTPKGTSVLGAALIDDIAGVLILALAFGAFGKSSGSIWLLLIKIGLFFVLSVFAGEWISRMVNKNIEWLKTLKSNYLLPVSIALILLFVISANEFGMAAIIGAYMIGVILSTTKLKRRMTAEIEKFGTGFFIPIFFVNIGLSVDLAKVGLHFGIALVIALAGMLSKVIGSGIGAKLSGFNAVDSFQIGVSMMPRAEVALIVSNIALKAGFIGEDIFVGVILLVITSSITAPALYKAVEKRRSRGKAKTNHIPKAA